MESDVDGLWLEFGTWKGETVNYISHLVKNKVYTFDSFTGLPEDWITRFPKGSFNRKGLIPEVRDNVAIVSGLFQDTLPNFLKKHANRPIKFLHIDCDLYSSTSFIFRAIEDRVTPGSVIVFDELIGYKGFEHHEFKAFNEFLKKTKHKFEVLCHNNFEQVALIIL